jgi:hypothetical protein
MTFETRKTVIYKASGDDAKLISIPANLFGPRLLVSLSVLESNRLAAIDVINWFQSVHAPLNQTSYRG